jgi:hypothetical protein
MTPQLAKTMALSAGLLACLALEGGVPTASAQDNLYGCACFHNKTGTNINYRYKWGDAEWKRVSLPAGYEQTLCWRYAQGSHSSPDLLFELDVDMSKGSAWTKYDIKRLQSPQNSCSAVGHEAQYDIDYRPNTDRGFIHVTHR